MKIKQAPQSDPLAATASSQSSQDRIEDLRAEISELKQDLIDAHRALAASRQEISTITTLGVQRAITIEARERDIATLKGAIHDIEQSRSWKLTVPVRMAAKALRNVQQRVEGMLGALRAKPAGMKSATDQVLSAATQVSPQPLLHIPPEIVEKVLRVRLLEQAMADLLTNALDSSGDGRYIHHVSHNINPNFLDLKAIAFYALQSSEPIRGRGFYGSTAEWAAVSKAVPRYLGQYQPHIPDDLGYYDLRIPDVFEKQVALAKQYGIYGFCFQCHRFLTDAALDLPLRQLLSDPRLDIAFCIALEADERQLEGRVDLQLQILGDFFADPRYIRIGGRPLFVLSKTTNAAQVQGWREHLSAASPMPIYIAGLCSSSASEALLSEFDAVIEDPLSDVVPQSDASLIDSNFKGDIYSYPALMEACTRRLDTSQVIFRNVLTGWDTEANNPGRGQSLAGASPGLYTRWFERSCRLTLSLKPEERFIFISSWNNWIEGSHLEPDHRFGYAYLHATANVLRSHHRDTTTESLISEINSRFSPSSDVAVIFHCFHEDLISPILDNYFSNLRGVDLFVTVREDISREAIETIRKRFDHVFFEAHENRGRDIRPFLFTLRRIQSLGYRFACKVHTKKTPHAGNGEGEVWRQRLMGTLLGASDSKSRAIQRFDQDKDLGLLVPSTSLQDLSERRHHIDNRLWLDRLLGRLERSDLAADYGFKFPAGSMYWFRVDALRGFDNLALDDDAFELELGQRDGTLAHAMERLVSLYAEQNGYRTEEIDLTDDLR